MNGIDQRIAQLSPAKRKLLEARLASAGAARDPIGVSASPVSSQETRAIAPSHELASVAQRRLWFVQRFAGDSSVYHNAHGIRLRGPLDIPRLQECFRQITARHQSLRMAFADTGDPDSTPAAVIFDGIELGIPLLDLSGLDQSRQQFKRDRVISELGRKPFDLTTAPLLRMSLLRFGDEDHLLVLIIHHIVSDRWSVGILLGELASLYAGEKSLMPLVGSYTDCAAREQARQSDPAMISHLEYWRTRLSDLPQPLDFPDDHPRPATPTHAGSQHVWTVPAELAGRVSKIGREQGATPFMTFLAAFLALACRSSGQEDIIIGTPLAGRHTVEAERLIGLFINVLPLRIQADPAESFTQFVGRVKSATLEMLAHQEVPFDRLVSELRIERDQSRHPLFGVVFNFHNVPYSPAWPPGLSGELEEIHPDHSRFDLTLTMRPTAGGDLDCEFEFSTDLFQRETIERMSRRFGTLLRSVAADPKLPIAQIPILDDAERQLLEQWSWPEPRLAPPTECPHEIFQRHAALTPDADALVFEDRRLTYRQLDEASNQFARRLRELGAGPGKLVAFCLRRNEMLPVAMMGVLKSGSAYVPLDPQYPRQRLEQMLEDSRAVILMTEHQYGDMFPAAPGRTVLKIDDADAGISSQPSAPLSPGATARDLAYVLFTSGSTGRPKGVAIEHRSVSASMEWARKAFSPDQLAGVLLSTSVCFDLSVLELLVPLCTGGKIILVQNILEFPDCPARREVTFISTVPSAMTELIRMQAIPETVLAAGLGGETLSAALLRQCYQSTSIRSVYNLYGPTEDTIYSTGALAPADCDGPPSIGKPIGGSRAYILDACLQLLPIGTSGELFVGGPKLAREYLHRPDLTAERFIPDPHGAPGERLYRTGDLCRWSNDGSLHFLGRIDHQIKLRGFRIELGEIETCLGRHPAIRQCLVIASGEGVEQRLIAYVVADARACPSEEDLREQLGSQLPGYMVPAAFVFLDAMPMTPNGKIDRRALPAPGTVARSPARRFVAPQTELQEQLAAIWREVLRIERVGIEDNFFELGGNSLRLMGVAARMHRSLGVEVSLQRYFERPTIAGIAEIIAAKRNSSPKQSLTEVFAVADDMPPEFRRTDPGPVGRLSYGQQRIWFLDRLDEQSIAYNVSFAQWIEGPLDVARLERAFAAVCVRHESLRTIFPEVDGVPTQITFPMQAAGIQIPLIELADVPPAELDARIREIVRDNARQRIDLAGWPLFRVKLLRVSPQRHVLSLCIHHIISDDWSMRLLYGEIAHFYSTVDATALPPLPIQYRDFADWQRRRLEGGEFERQSNYWRNQLAGAPVLLQMPGDRPRPAMQTHRAARVPVCIPADVARSVRTLARHEKATMFVALLAAFNLFLSRWTGQRDIVVGTPVTNRDHPATHSAVGFFLNTLAIRTKLHGNGTFRELLQGVRQTALDAFAHQHLPFEKLIEQLSLPRNLGHAPLVQVMFVLLNDPPVRLELEGTQSTFIPSSTGYAKFDLLLSLHESADAIEGWIEFNTDLFDSATITDIAARWIGMLRECAADADRPLGLGGATESPPSNGHSVAPEAAPRPAIVKRQTARNAAEQKLLAIWRDVLNVPNAGINDSFFDLGGHSLLAVRLMHQIKRQLGAIIPLARLFEAPTVAQLSAFIPSDESAATLEAPTSESNTLVRIWGEGNGVPLFCVSGAGGHGFSFHPLARLLSPQRPVYALQYPEIEIKSYTLADVKRMASQFIAEVRRACPNGPYALAGYSFGGIVAYEMARQLTANGQRIGLLALFDSAAPGTIKKRPIHRQAIEHFKRVWALGPAGWPAYVAERLRRFAPLRTAITAGNGHAEAAKALAQTIRTVRAANVHADPKYRQEPYPGAIVLFRSVIRPESGSFFIDHSTNGWSLLSPHVDVLHVPGTHTTMLQEPNVAILARELSNCLSRPGAT